MTSTQCVISTEACLPNRGLPVFTTRPAAVRATNADVRTDARVARGIGRVKRILRGYDQTSNIARRCEERKKYLLCIWRGEAFTVRSMSSILVPTYWRVFSYLNTLLSDKVIRTADSLFGIVYFHRIPSVRIIEIKWKLRKICTYNFWKFKQDVLR